VLVRTIGVTSDGADLEAELVVPEMARAIVILCRGLPSGAPRDPSDPDYPGLARDLAASRYAGVSFNFRGCYSAPGDFSIAGWCRDLDAIIDGVRAREEVRGLPVVLVGSSAGGAVADVVSADTPRPVTVRPEGSAGVRRLAASTMAPTMIRIVATSPNQTSQRGRSGRLITP